MVVVDKDVASNMDAVDMGTAANKPMADKCIQAGLDVELVAMAILHPSRVVVEQDFLLTRVMLFPK